MQTSSGMSLDAGISKMGLSANTKCLKLSLIAKRWNQMKQEFEKSELRFDISLTGLGASFGLSKDLIQEIAGVSVARQAPDYNGNFLYLNNKNQTELSSFEFNGPCSLISYSGLKVNLLTDLKDYAGQTYLYIGQGTTVVDKSEDWLKRIVDNSTSSTLGGNFKTFNAGNGPFSNARAICPLNLIDKNLGAKFECSVAIFSGTVTSV